MSKPRFRWTTEKTDFLIKNREQTIPMDWSKIASQLGLTIIQCQDKMNRVRETRLDFNQQNEDIERTCLSCRQTFSAPTKYVRVCTPCKSTRVWR